MGAAVGADPAIAAVLAGSWRGRPSATIGATGYVAHALEAALWPAHPPDPRTALLAAANLAQDADTTAAVTGQIIGALEGASGLTQDWVGRVAWNRSDDQGDGDALREGSGGPLVDPRSRRTCMWDRPGRDVV